jgi:hypothetical protein
VDRILSALITFINLGFGLTRFTAPAKRSWLGLDGLFPPSTGARVSHADGTATVTDRPFAEAKEAIGGYWIIQVRSREEALEWARRAPMASNEIIEVRQIYDRVDLSMVVQKEPVQKAAEGFEEHSNAAAAKA